MPSLKARPERTVMTAAYTATAGIGSLDSDAHQNSVCRQYGVAVIRYRMGFTAEETNGKQTYSSEYCPNMTPNVPS